MLDLSALFMSSALKGKELKEYGFFFFYFYHSNLHSTTEISKDKSVMFLIFFSSINFQNQPQ